MKKTICRLLLVGLLLMPVRPAHADDGSMKGRLIIGQDFTLKSGETMDGDLVVIGGGAAIEQGARVQGDIVVIGGGLRLDGETTASAVVIGGTASLGTTASVGADLVTLGGALQRAEGARIGGDIITNVPLPALEFPGAASVPPPPLPRAAQFPFDFGPIATLAAVLFKALGLAALAMLLTAFVHPQLDRVAQVIVTQSFAAGSIGLLTVFLAPLAVVIMAITLILIPLALAAILLLVLAWLFGVIALGQLVGERLTRASHRPAEPVLSAGLGTFVLGIVLATSNHIPCIGWLAAVIIGLLALGAVVLTMFGTRINNPTPGRITVTNSNDENRAPLPPSS